jgi:hypothetical protein
MNQAPNFSASDAERQAADSAEAYLNNALRILAERLGWGRLLEADPAGFAARFAPLLAVMIEVQAREYQSWVLFDRPGAADETLLSCMRDMADALEGKRGRT